MKVNDIPKLLDSIWPVRDKVVPCFLSRPGIGKTEQIYAYAKSRGAKVVEIIASQILPSEVSGLTMPDSTTKSMEIYDHARLSSLKDGDILFFDELLQGSPQVLSACLTLIQERRLMSGRKLPDIMIVAAANPTVSPKMVPEAVRQRFMFLDVAFEYNQWKDYMENRYGILVDNDFSSILVKIGFQLGGNTEWNEISPRDATKLLLWYKSAMAEFHTRTIVKETIAQGYNLAVADAVTNSCERKKAKTTEEILDDVIGKIGLYYVENGHSVSRHDEEKLAELNDQVQNNEVTPVSIMEFISSLDDPEGLRNYLDEQPIERENVII